MQIVNFNNYQPHLFMTANQQLNPEENENKDNVFYLGIPENLETKNLETPDVDSYTQKYFDEKDLSPETIKYISKLAKVEQEKTRKNIAEKLLVFFGGSLGITYLLIGFASMSPQSDKPFIREMIPIIITPQVTLLGVALGFYFKDQG